MIITNQTSYQISYCNIDDIETTADLFIPFTFINTKPIVFVLCFYISTTFNFPATITHTTYNTYVLTSTHTNPDILVFVILDNK